jgi:hypothetical protein
MMGAPTFISNSIFHNQGRALRMTRSFALATRAITAAMFLAVAPCTYAADGPQPGMWKVMTRVIRDGTTTKSDSHTSCVTADQIKDPGKSLMPQPSSSEEKCVRTHYEWTGSKLNWQMECSGRMAMKGSGAINFSTPEHYTGKITSTGSVNGHDFTSTILLDGQRIGDCPK